MQIQCQALSQHRDAAAAAADGGRVLACGRSICRYNLHWSAASALLHAIRLYVAALLLWRGLTESNVKSRANNIQIAIREVC